MTEIAKKEQITKEDVEKVAQETTVLLNSSNLVPLLRPMIPKPYAHASSASQVPQDSETYKKYNHCEHHCSLPRIFLNGSRPTRPYSQVIQIPTELKHPRDLQPVIQSEKITSYIVEVCWYENLTRLCHFRVSYTDASRLMENGQGYLYTARRLAPTRIFQSNLSVYRRQSEPSSSWHIFTRSISTLKQQVSGSGTRVSRYSPR